MKKGEKSTPVIYYKILEKRDEAGNMVVREDGSPARIPFVRWANVFNLDQTEGIPAPDITTSQNVTQPHEKAAAIVENAKLCPIHHGGFAALYSRMDDVIRIPAPATFRSPEDYYHTLYHEMTHATGHTSRLDRKALPSTRNSGQTAIPRKSWSCAVSARGKERNYVFWIAGKIHANPTYRCR